MLCLLPIYYSRTTICEGSLKFKKKAKMLFLFKKICRRHIVGGRRHLRAMQSVGLEDSLSRRRRQDAAAGVLARLVLLAHRYRWFAITSISFQLRYQRKSVNSAGGLCLLYGTAIRICELRMKGFVFETFLQTEDTLRRQYGSLFYCCVLHISSNE